MEESADGTAALTAALTAHLGSLKAKYVSPRQGGECHRNRGFNSSLVR